MTEKNCAHPSCSCSVELDELFCSTSCRALVRESSPEDLERTACACGHPGCLGAAGRAGETALSRAPGTGGTEIRSEDP